MHNKQLPQCGKRKILQYAGKNRISPMEKDKFPQLVNKEFPLMGKWGISPTGLSKIIPDFPRFWKFPLTGGRASRDFFQVCYYHITYILRFRIKWNMAAIWIFSRHAVFGDFSTPKTKSGFGIKLQNWINLSSGTDFLSLPKLLTEIWPFKPHF